MPAQRPGAEAAPVMTAWARQGRNSEGVLGATSNTVGTGPAGRTSAPRKVTGRCCRTKPKRKSKTKTLSKAKRKQKSAAAQRKQKIAAAQRKPTSCLESIANDTMLELEYAQPSTIPSPGQSIERCEHQHEQKPPVPEQDDELEEEMNQAIKQARKLCVKLATSIRNESPRKANLCAKSMNMVKAQQCDSRSDKTSSTINHNRHAMQNLKSKTSPADWSSTLRGRSSVVSLRTAVSAARFSTAVKKRRRSRIASSVGLVKENKCIPWKTVAQMDSGLPRHTSTDYWDGMASDWCGEIQSTIDDDRNGILVKLMNEYIQPDFDVIDFGCGVGKYIPALASRARHVTGIDISRKLIEVARKDCASEGITNVSFKTGDLANVDLRKKGVDECGFACCANVLISPEPYTRLSILRNLHKHLSMGGLLMLVVPAVASAKLIIKTHADWIKYRRAHKFKPDKKKEAAEQRNIKDMSIGVYRRDGVRTKHFREAELKGMLKKNGFKTLALEQVQYEWSTELDEPTHFLGEDGRYPFDWLVVAEKKGPWVQDTDPDAGVGD